MIRLAVYLEIEGDEQNAQHVVDELLDVGEFQNQIRNHDVIDAGAMRVTSSCVRPAPRYRVRYYDRVKSHRGQGVQSRTFLDLDEARTFAAENILYSRPCIVEVV
jgi:hypothetical protein